MKKLLLFLLIVLSNVALAQQMTCTTMQSKNFKYLEYKPPIGTPIRGAILYLHGLDERGTNIELVKKNEIPKLFTKTSKVKPYIIICPQLQAGKKGFDKAFLVECFKILDSYKLPRHVTGLSLGGMGTYSAVVNSYDYNKQKKGYFKTACSIAGKCQTTDYKRFDSLYTIIYHNSGDPKIGVGLDRILYRQATAYFIQEYGETVYNTKPLIYKTEFISSTHGGWSTAYSDGLGNYWDTLERLGF